MKRTNPSQRNLNWEQEGYNVMREVRNLDRAKQVCAYKLQALSDERHPDITRSRAFLNELRARANALAAQLYQRHHPVSDTKMLALCGLCAFLLMAFIMTFAVSLVGNTMTLLKFGWDLIPCALVGLFGTALVTVVGQQTHAKLLARFPVLDTAMHAPEIAKSFMLAAVAAEPPRGDVVRELLGRTDLAVADQAWLGSQEP